MGRIACIRVENIDVDYLFHLAYGHNKYSRQLRCLFFSDRKLSLKELGKLNGVLMESNIYACM